MYYEKLKFFIDTYFLIFLFIPMCQEGLYQTWHTKSVFRKLYDELAIYVCTIGAFTATILLTAVVLTKRDWKSGVQVCITLVLLALILFLSGIIVYIAPLMRRFQTTRHLLKFDEQLSGIFYSIINTLSEVVSNHRILLT